MPPSTVVALFGPTGVGKTAVAIALADLLRAEGEDPVAVSADALQVYRGLETLTGAATADEQRRLEHRLLSFLPVDAPFSAGEYARLAHATIDELLATGRRPIVVGGTGLYLRAALADLDLPPAPRPGARELWERAYDELGPERTHEALVERDPEAAARVHPNDRRRVVRALELTEAGSSLAPGADRLWSGELRHPTLLVGLDVPPDVLERRIEERTRAMFDRGAEEEARRALAGPISATARTIHGLRELAELPRDDAFAELVTRTRRYAAYQRKWMRRIPGLVSLPADRPPGEVADAILEVARPRQRLPAGPAR